MSTDDPVIIVAAKRTAIGNLGGGLSRLPAHELGSIVVAQILQDTGVKPDEIDDVIMGQVLTAGAGQNPARQTAIAAGIPAEKAAYTINQVCGSGLRTVALGMQSILCGDADIVVAGGQENMSGSPHAMHMRDGVKFGNAQMIDTMINDGLWDSFNDYHMGITAENIAEKYSISREAQDEFAAASQNKAEAAIAAGADGFLAKPVDRLGAFQSAISRHLPPERRVRGPHPVSGEVVHPDRLAFREDMAHLDAVMRGPAEGRDLDYVAQFLRGIARSAGDRPLEEAAHALARSRREGRTTRPDEARIAGLVRERLAETEVI